MNSIFANPTDQKLKRSLVKMAPYLIEWNASVRRFYRKGTTVPVSDWEWLHVCREIGQRLNWDQHHDFRRALEIILTEKAGEEGFVSSSWQRRAKALKIVCDQYKMQAKS